MIHAVSAFVTLFAFWLLLSGFFTAFLMTAGAGCALGVVLFARRMAVIDRESLPVHMGLRLVGYWLWLLKEIVKSGWSVTKIIASPSLPISPTMTSFTPTQTSDVGRVIHANSITLTPGTIAVECEPGRFVVHGLTRDAAQGACSGDMDARVTACEVRH